MKLLDNLLGEKKETTCDTGNYAEEGSTVEKILTEYIDRMNILKNRYYGFISLHNNANKEKKKFYENELKDILKDMTNWADDVDYTVLLEEGVDERGEKETAMHVVTCKPIYFLRRFIKFETPFALGNYKSTQLTNGFWEKFLETYEKECGYNITISTVYYESTAEEFEKHFDGICKVKLLTEEKEIKYESE